MIDQDRRDVLITEIGEAFVAELTQLFWADAWPLLDEAVARAAAADGNATRRALHTIAGSASNLGLRAIASAAEAANHAVKSGLVPDFRPLREAMNATSAWLESKAAA